MLSQNMISHLNQQIDLEHYSANLYLQMGAWCTHRGFVGCGEFLRNHAGQEQQHMHRLFVYVSETGALPLLGPVAAPRADYADLGEVFQQTLDHERTITGRINELVESALQEKDFATFQFLQWYVSEQHEEEALFQRIVDMIKVIGLDGRGAYFFDKEIRKLTTPLAARQS